MSKVYKNVENETNSSLYCNTIYDLNEVIPDAWIKGQVFLIDGANLAKNPESRAASC